jgi:hypothetical protein
MSLANREFPANTTVSHQPFGFPTPGPARNPSNIIFSILPANGYINSYSNRALSE